MSIATELANISLLGVETAPFIYFVERHPTYLARMRLIFQMLSAGAFEVVSSAITLTEVLMLPIQAAQTHFEQEYRAMLLNTDGIATVSVTPEIAIRAAWLRARYGFRTPDALHVATAIETGCDAFLTNDRKLQRVAEIRVLVLDDL